MRNTFIEINLKNLNNNIQKIADSIGSANIMPVIKANAYGHGMIGIAKNLNHPKIDMLGIAYPSEGIELRNIGETRKILLLIPPEVEEITDVIDNNLDITIGHIHYINEINEIARKRHAKIKAHLYVNTGMNRDGNNFEEYKHLVPNLESYKNIEFKGICSHFATSDMDDKTFAQFQINNFKQFLDYAESHNLHFKYRHISNSAGIVNLPNAIFDIVRPGFAIYGLMPQKHLADKLDLKPVLSLKTFIKKIFSVNSGETAGYSLKFTADKPTKIAVLPIGYGDGIVLNLTNNAQCLIKGKRYDLVGSICMDQLFADIGNDNIDEGEQVVLIGKQGNEEISVYELADRANTIPYNITTSILKRVPRFFTEGNV